MRLYGNEISPYVRKVRVVAAECGLTGEIEFMAASGTPLDPGTTPTALNPLGKVPVLEREDGGALYDSGVICRYLDDRAGGRLYPSGSALWEALTLEATADGILDAALTMVYEARLRPEEHRSSAIVEGQWAKISRALGSLEARWLSHLAGRARIGQIAVAVALAYLDFRHGSRAWRTGSPALAEFADRWTARPSMQETAPPPA